MAKTIDDLKQLLADQGHDCREMFDALVVAELPTKTYKHPTGRNQLELVLSFDRPNDCVAVEILNAFQLGKAAFPEATLACLMTAAARAPLLRPSLDPVDGEIRLRVDCPCGADGASDEDVLRAVNLLTSVAENWYPQISAAMEEGNFDANQMTRITLSRLMKPGLLDPSSSAQAGRAGEQAAEKTGDKETHAEDRADIVAEPDGGEPADGDRPAGKKPNVRDVFRAAAISNKPGAQPSRLKVLFDFKKWLDEKGRNFGNQN
jgi:hypothetical protein